MTKFTNLFTAVAVASISVVGIGSCGGNSPSGDIVAQVGKASISRAMLSEWMEAVAGGDYYEHVGGPAPRGLVSDPPNYPRCIGAAEEIMPRSALGQLTMTTSQLAGKCRELHQALKVQALELLISIESKIGEGEELGIPATTAQVNQAFSRIKAREFPKQAEYEAYLAAREWPQAVETLQLKRNVVVSRLAAKFRAKGQGWQHAYVQYVLGSAKKWTAKTSCRPGYVVSTCREYKPSPAHETAPSRLLEELTGRP